MASSGPYSPSPESLPLVSDVASQENMNGFNAVLRDENSFAGSLPADQGLYSNENEKDSCGVGFICHIKGEPTHKIVSDARQLLCAMTHRGATGADSRDGDGAGVMTAIPHGLFKREAERDLGCVLPDPGEYAVGNVFFKANDPVQLQSHQTIFTNLAKEQGLRVLGWREVPTDPSILGPAASSKEPTILQPFVVLRSHYGEGNVSQGGTFDATHFERQLYVLRKHATHSMLVIKFNFSISSMSSCPSVREVLSPEASMYAPCLPKTSSTRANYPLRKFTTTTTTSTTFCTSLTSHLCTLVSPPTLSPAGIVLSP